MTNIYKLLQTQYFSISQECRMIEEIHALYFLKIYLIDFAITVVPFFSPLYSLLPCPLPLTIIPPP